MTLEEIMTKIGLKTKMFGKCISFNFLCIKEEISINYLEGFEISKL